MSSQDELRHWIKTELAAQNRGARARLAEFLDLTPLQITYMLNTETGKQNRNILADEWLKILLFLGVETGSALPRAELENGKPVLKMPAARCAKKSAQRTKLMAIFDNATPKQQRLILGLISALADSCNISY